MQTINYLKKYIRNNIFFIAVSLLITLLVFRKYIFQNLLPIPGDILPGLYYPWFDYKWGYETPIPVKNSLPSDVISILYPWRILGIRIIKEGILPLWDSSILLGTPLLANFQSSLLNPLNLLFFIVGETKAWSLQVILQPFLMMLGIYLFMRNLKFGKIVSVFSGILYAFSGYSIVWMEYNSINYTLVFLPMMLWSVSKLFYEEKFKWVFVTSMFLCFQVLMGYPLNSIYSIIFVFFYYVYFVLTEKKLSLKTLFYFFMAIAFGICIAAIQLIPSIELYLLSIRKFDTLAIASKIKFLPLSHLITFFIPDYFGNPATGNYWGVGSYDNFAFAVISPGVYFFLLFLTTKETFNKKFAFFLISLFFILVYVTENIISQSALLNNFIGLSASVNTRSLYIFTFIVSVLAGAGFETALKRKISGKQKIFPLVIFILLFLFIIKDYIFLNKFNITDFINALRSSRADFSNTIISIRNSFIPILSVVLVYCLLFINNKKTILIGTFVIIILVTVYSTDKYLSFIKGDLMYPNVPALDYLQKNLETSRFSKEASSLVFPSNSWTLYGINSPSGQNASTLYSTAKYMAIINKGFINDQLLTRYGEIDNSRSPLFNTLNVSYFVSINMDKVDSPNPDGKARGWLLPEKVSETKNIKTVRIYKNEDNLGAAWFPRKVVCLNSEAEIARLISKSNYNAKDKVYVNCTDFEGLDTIPGSVDLGAVGRNFKNYFVDTKNDNYLVLSESYYPGWKYSIDGRYVGPVKSVANIALRAVFVPSGKHNIKVFYDPFSFKLGLAVSLVSLLLLIMIMKFKLIK